MTLKIYKPRAALFRVIGSFALVVLGLTGCMHMSLVTDRPEFAYPQNLLSLCERNMTLTIANRGGFVSAGGFKSDEGSTDNNRILLSAQLIAGEPEWHRLIDRLQLEFIVGQGVLLTALDGHGKAFKSAIEAVDIGCVAGDELTASFATDSSYFYASVGTNHHELVFWTNAQQELVMHSRWKHSMVGLIGGAVTGDGWAIFDRVEFDPLAVELSSIESAVLQECQTLSGTYDFYGENVLEDGTLDVMSAAELLFPDEVQGMFPERTSPLTGTRLVVEQSTSESLLLQLYDESELLVEREVPTAELVCESGHWQLDSSAQSVTSGWLWLMGTGGIESQQLSLWRDAAGSLLIQSESKMRGAILLVPYGDHRSWFVAFEQLDMAE